MLSSKIWSKLTGLARKPMQDRQGTATLEMAIMLPVLLVIGFGVLEFGNLIFKRHLIEAGVRDAARYMAGIPDCDAPDRQVAADLATFGNIDATPPHRVENWTLEPDDIVCDSSVSADITVGGNTVTLRGGIGGNLTIIRINDTVDYSSLGLGYLNLLSYFGVGFNTLTFHVRHEERWYGNR